MRSRALYATFSLLAIMAASAIAANSAIADYGVSSFSSTFLEQGNSPAVSAGEHPYAQRTSIAFNEHFDELFAIDLPDGNLKDLMVAQPFGFAGNVTGFPKCPMLDFLAISKEH